MTVDLDAHRFVAYRDPRSGDMRLAYVRAGDPYHPAIVLIRGLGTQLIEWPQSLLGRLLDGGLQVVAFDNRDAGLSTKLDTATGPPAYRLDDMANDVIALLDGLGLASAHIFGISLGGMVAQHMAFSHAARVRTLFSVMSTTSRPGLPGPTAAAVAALRGGPADAREPEQIIAFNAMGRAAFGSPGFPVSEAERRDKARRAYLRSHTPAGVTRQMQALDSDGSRVERLQRITAPSLVIHGRDDPLIPLAAGEDTARSIPGARLAVIDGMGHDIPEALGGRIADLVLHFVAARG